VIVIVVVVVVVIVIVVVIVVVVCHACRHSYCAQLRGGVTSTRSATSIPP